MTSMYGAVAVALIAGSFAVAPAFAAGLGGTLGGTIGATVGGGGSAGPVGGGATMGAESRADQGGFGAGANVDVSVTVGLNRILNRDMPELAPERASKPRIVNLDELSGHTRAGATAEVKADTASELVKRLKERKQKKANGEAASNDETTAPGAAQWNGEGGPIDEKTAAENQAATASAASDVNATLSTMSKTNAEADTKVSSESRNWFDIF
jgi:hypothetical protein